METQNIFVLDAPYRARTLIPIEKTETLALGYNVRMPNAPLVTETHSDEEEIYIILEGRGRLHLGGEESEICAGQTVYVPRNVEHGMVCISDAPMKYLFVANWPGQSKEVQA
jgi:mannose-6-phosphate isomerase-like protein (cupin superfamily)